MQKHYNLNTERSQNYKQELEKLKNENSHLNEMNMKLQILHDKDQQLNTQLEEEIQTLQYKLQKQGDDLVEEVEMLKTQGNALLSENEQFRKERSNLGIWLKYLQNHLQNYVNPNQTNPTIQTLQNSLTLESLKEFSNQQTVIDLNQLPPKRGSILGNVFEMERKNLKMSHNLNDYSQKLLTLQKKLDDFVRKQGKKEIYTCDQLQKFINKNQGKLDTGTFKELIQLQTNLEDGEQGYLIGIQNGQDGIVRMKEELNQVKEQKYQAEQKSLKLNETNIQLKIQLNELNEIIFDKEYKFSKEILQLKVGNLSLKQFGDDYKKKCQKLLTDLEDLSEICQIQKRKFTEVEKENSQKKQRIGELEEEFYQLQSGNQELKEEIHQNALKYNELDIEYRNYKDLQERIMEKYNQEKEEYEQYKRIYYKLQIKKKQIDAQHLTEMESLQQEILKEKQKQNSLNTILQTKDNKINHVIKQSEAYKNEIENQKSICQCYEKKCEQQRQLSLELKQHNEDLGCQHKEKLMQIQMQIQKEKQKQNDLKRVISQKDKEIQALTKDCLDFSSQLKRFQQECTEHKTKYEQQKRIYQNLATGKRKLKDQKYEQLKKEHVCCKNELNEACTKLNQLQEMTLKYKDAQNQKKLLNLENQDLRGAVEVLKKGQLAQELNQNQKDYETKRQLQQLNQEITTLQEQLSDKNKEVMDKEKQFQIEALNFQREISKSKVSFQSKLDLQVGESAKHQQRCQLLDEEVQGKKEMLMSTEQQLEKQIQQYNQLIQVHKDEKNNSQLKFQKLQEEYCQEAQQNIKNHEEKCTSLKCQLSQQKEKTKKAKEQLQDYHKEFTKLINDHDDHKLEQEKRIHLLEKQLQGRIVDINLLKKLNDEANEEIHFKDQKLLELQGELEIIKERGEESINKCEFLKEKLDENVNKLGRLNNELDYYQNQLAELKEANKGFKQEAHLNEQTQSQLEKELENYKHEHAKQKQQCQQLENELSQKEQKLKALKSENTKIQQKVTELSEKLNYEQQKALEQEEKKNEYEEKCTSLENELNLKLTKFQKLIKEYQDQYMQNEKAKIQLQKELEDFKEICNMQKKQCDSLKEKLSRQTNEAQRISRELKDFQLKCGEIQEVNDEFKRQLQNYEQQHQQRVQEIGNYKHQLSNQKKRCSHLEDELSLRKQDLRRAEQEKNECDHTILALEESQKNGELDNQRKLGKLKGNISQLKESLIKKEKATSIQSNQLSDLKSHLQTQILNHNETQEQFIKEKEVKKQIENELKDYHSQFMVLMEKSKLLQNILIQESKKSLELKTHNDSLILERETLSKDLLSIQKQYATLKQELQRQLENIEEASQNEVRIKQKNQWLSDELKLEKQQLKKVENDFYESSQQFSKLQNIVNDQKRAMKSQKDQYNTLQKEHKSFQEQTKQLTFKQRNKYQLLEQELKKAKEQISNLRDQFQNSKAKLLKSQSQVDKSYRELKEQEYKLNNQINLFQELTKKCNEYKEEMNRLNFNVNLVKQNNGNLTKKMISLLKIIDQQNLQQKKQEGQQKFGEQKILNQEEVITNQNQQLNELNQQSLLLQDQAKKSKSECLQLHNKSQKYKELVDHFENLIEGQDQKQQEYEQLEQEYKDLEVTRGELRKQFGDVKDENTILANEVTRLKVEITNTNKKFHQSQIKCAKYKVLLDLLEKDSKPEYQKQEHQSEDNFITKIKQTKSIEIPFELQDNNQTQNIQNKSQSNSFLRAGYLNIYSMKNDNKEVDFE